MKEQEITIQDVEYRRTALKKVGQSFALDLNAAFNNIGASLKTQKDKDAFMNSDLVENITSTQYENAFGDVIDEEPEPEVYIDTVGQDLRTPKVQNQEAFRDYRSSMESAADELEKIVDKETLPDATGLKMNEFMKSYTPSKLRRIAKGYSDNAIIARTPLGEGAKAILACVDTRMEDDALRHNIEKWQNRFPVYDFIIDSEKQLTTMAQYWEEKENSKEGLSPEREAFYRQRIYDLTISQSVYFNKIISESEKLKINDEIRKDRVISPDNDAFHLHPRSHRGAKSMAASLDAYKAGLEHGWHLEDIAYLAAFCRAIKNQEYSCTGNGSLNANEFKDYSKNPKYRSPEHKKFIEDSLKYYDQIKNKTFTSEKDRNETLEKMHAIIQQGTKEGYLKHPNINGELVDDAATKYFNSIWRNKIVRDYDISIGKERAFETTPILTGDDRKISIAMADLTTERTDLWFSSENAEHKKLRLAAEELQKFMKDNPKDKALADGKTDAQKQEYLAKYQSKLKAVQFYGKIYQDKRLKASSVGGKARLRGATGLVDFAGVELDTISKTMDSFQKGPVSNAAGLEIKLATDNWMQANFKLMKMKEFPKEEKAAKEVTELVADVIVGIFSAEHGTYGRKAAVLMGADALKQEILGSDSMKAMMKSYVKDKSKSPADLANELQNGTALKKFPKLSEQFAPIDKAAKQASENKKAFEAERKEYWRKEKQNDEKYKAEVKAKKAAERKAREEAERKAQEAQNAKDAKKAGSTGNKKTVTEPKTVIKK